MALLGLAGSAGSAGSAGTAIPVQKPLAAGALTSIGPGYSVVKQGELSASSFAASSPNPPAAATAFGDQSADKTISTYERVWADGGGNNQVQVLLVRFDRAPEAQAYLSSVRQALQSDEIVSSGAMPGVKGAFRTTYFATTPTQAGVGQAVVADVGTTVATLSFFSSNASSDLHPITVSGARAITELQLAALRAVVEPKPKAVVLAPAPATDPNFYWIWGASLGVLLVIVGVLLLAIRRRASKIVTVKSPSLVVVIEPEPRIGRQDIPVVLGLVAAWLFKPRSKP
jgi:hypothetical protein